MPPQKLAQIKDWASVVTCVGLIAGAIGTYAVTRAKVDELVVYQREQAQANREVADRLARIETRLEIVPRTSWADRDRGR